MDTCAICHGHHSHWMSCDTYANLRDVPTVTDEQLRHIWGWLSSCPGERPLSAALEQALESARREYPAPRSFRFHPAATFPVEPPD